MSAGRDPRPAPLLLKDPEIPDDMVHPVPGTVLKIPGTPDQATVIADNQAKMRSLIILDKDIPVLCGNGFSLFAGKGAVRQPLKYSLILISPVMPRTGRGGCHCLSSERNVVIEVIRGFRRLLRLRLRGLTSTAFRFRATFFRRVSTLWLPILLRLRLRLSVLLWCTPQHLHGARGLNKNFSDVTGDTVIFPTTGTELPLDVDLLALVQIFTGHFRELAEQHHAMPFCLLPNLPRLFVTPAF